MYPECKVFNRAKTELRHDELAYISAHELNEVSSVVRSKERVFP